MIFDWFALFNIQLVFKPISLGFSCVLFAGFCRKPISPDENTLKPLSGAEFHSFQSRDAPCHIWVYVCTKRLMASFGEASLAEVGHLHMLVERVPHAATTSAPSTFCHGSEGGGRAVCLYFLAAGCLSELSDCGCVVVVFWLLLSLRDRSSCVQSFRKGPGTVTEVYMRIYAWTPKS